MIIKIIKRIIYAICLIYTINLLTYSVGCIIPINIYTVSFIAFTDVFGLIAIIVIKVIL